MSKFGPITRQEAIDDLAVLVSELNREIAGFISAFPDIKLSGRVNYCQDDSAPYLAVTLELTEKIASLG